MTMAAAPSSAIPTTSTSPPPSHHQSSSSKKNKAAGFRKFLCMLSLSPYSKQQQQQQQDNGGAAPSSEPPPLTKLATGNQAQDQGSELERVFRCFDENGDGKISPAELRNCLRAAGEELSSEDAEAVVESTDSDGDGQLGLEDFAKLVTAEGEDDKGRNLKDAFRMYAGEEQEYITPKSLGRMLKRLGDSRTSIEECTAMIRFFDLNGDGVLSFDEFQTMMI